MNGDVGAGAHDDAEIGLGQRGGIIDPVADHGDHPALGPQMAHDLGLLPGLHRRCPITGDEDDEKRSTDKNSGFTGLAPSEMAASQAVKVPEFDMPTHNRTARSAPSPHALSAARWCPAEGVLGRPSEALRPRSARRGKVYAPPQQRAMPERPRPTQPPTRPTASRTGRRRPADPRDLLIDQPPCATATAGTARSPPGPNRRKPRPTAPNEHRVGERNVDNISCPTSRAPNLLPLQRTSRE
jgi:hypothetical protein